MANSDSNLSADDTALLKQALLEIIGVTNKVMLKQVAMEAAVQELVSTMAEPQRACFANTFRVRAEELLQTHSDRLLPDDDAAIALVVANFLKAARRPNRHEE